MKKTSQALRQEYFEVVVVTQLVMFGMHELEALPPWLTVVRLFLTVVTVPLCVYSSAKWMHYAALSNVPEEKKGGRDGAESP